jgi:hypothetical protein
VKNGPKRRPEAKQDRRPKLGAQRELIRASRIPDGETYKIKQIKDLFASFGLAGTGVEQVE